MEQRFFYKLMATQLIKKSRLLWVLKIHYRFQKYRPLHRVLSQKNPIHILISYVY